MKKLSTLIALMLVAMMSMAQSKTTYTMNVHLVDGTTESFAVADVDSVDFSEVPVEKVITDVASIYSGTMDVSTNSITLLSGEETTVTIVSVDESNVTVSWSGTVTISSLSVPLSVDCDCSATLEDGVVTISGSTKMDIPSLGYTGLSVSVSGTSVLDEETLALTIYVSSINALVEFDGIWESSVPEIDLETAISNLDEIVPITENIGDWDEGYITNKGYFLHRDSIAAVSSGHIKSLYYMSVDGGTRASLFTTNGKLPHQFIINGETLYFSFLNDSVLEVLSADESAYELLYEIAYDKTILTTKVEKYGFENSLQIELAYLVGLLQEAGLRSDHEELTNSFSEILDMEVCDDPDAALQELEEQGLTLDDDGYEFASNITEQYEEEIIKVAYNITIWTGSASFKVGGTSCTLSGTIWCASETFNDLGTYGIVCSTNPDSLYVDVAEYEGEGYQESLSLHYDVDFRGLKANTTYYYRAYYKFNNSDHGSLKFTYGDPDADINYDSVIKSFTTGDNCLNVDVVMCIDGTGSMSSLISTVKTNALSFYESFNETCVDNGIELQSLNTQVICFRDINVDGDDAMQESSIYSLPDEADDFSTFVSALKATGGGDTPESGLEALYSAFEKIEDAVDDGYHRQVIILWTDAPYLLGDSYTSYTTSILAEKWATLSSGRRLILFAPSGTSGSHSGSWAEFDDWKNVTHITNVSTSFTDLDYILENIIEELTGTGSSAANRTPSVPTTYFAPNE